MGTWCLPSVGGGTRLLTGQGGGVFQRPIADGGRSGGSPRGQLPSQRQNQKYTSGSTSSFMAEFPGGAQPISGVHSLCVADAKEPEKSKGHISWFLCQNKWCKPRAGEEAERIILLQTLIFIPFVQSSCNFTSLQRNHVVCGSVNSLILSKSCAVYFL